VTVFGKFIDERLGQYFHDAEGFDVGDFQRDFKGLAEIKGHREFVFGEWDHNINEVSEGRFESVLIVVLFMEEVEPDFKLDFVVPGGNVDLLVEAPVILHELFALVGVPLHLGLAWVYFLTFDDLLGQQHPFDELQDHLQVVVK
jgi:hypothetical protein